MLGGEGNLPYLSDGYHRTVHNRRGNLSNILLPLEIIITRMVVYESVKRTWLLIGLFYLGFFVGSALWGAANPYRFGNDQLYYDVEIKDITTINYQPYYVDGQNNHYDFYLSNLGIVTEIPNKGTAPYFPKFYPFSEIPEHNREVYHEFALEIPPYWNYRYLNARVTVWGEGFNISSASFRFNWGLSPGEQRMFLNSTLNNDPNVSKVVTGGLNRYREYIGVIDLGLTAQNRAAFNIYVQVTNVGGVARMQIKEFEFTAAPGQNALPDTDNPPVIISEQDTVKVTYPDHPHYGDTSQVLDVGDDHVQLENNAGDKYWIRQDRVQETTTNQLLSAIQYYSNQNYTSNVLNASYNYLNQAANQATSEGMQQAVTILTDMLGTVDSDDDAENLVAIAGILQSIDLGQSDVTITTNYKEGDLLPDGTTVIGDWEQDSILVTIANPQGQETGLFKAEDLQAFYEQAGGLEYKFDQALEKMDLLRNALLNGNTQRTATNNKMDNLVTGIANLNTKATATNNKADNTNNLLNNGNQQRAQVNQNLGDLKVINADIGTSLDAIRTENAQGLAGIASKIPVLGTTINQGFMDAIEDIGITVDVTGGFDALVQINEQIKEQIDVMVGEPEQQVGPSLIVEADIVMGPEGTQVYSPAHEHNGPGSADGYIVDWTTTASGVRKARVQRNEGQLYWEDITNVYTRGETIQATLGLLGELVKDTNDIKITLDFANQLGQQRNQELEAIKDSNQIIATEAVKWTNQFDQMLQFQQGQAQWNLEANLYQQDQTANMQRLEGIQNQVWGQVDPDKDNRQYIIDEYNAKVAWAQEQIEQAGNDLEAKAQEAAQLADQIMDKVVFEAQNAGTLGTDAFSVPVLMPNNGQITEKAWNFWDTTGTFATGAYAGVKVPSYKTVADWIKQLLIMALSGAFVYICVMTMIDFLNIVMRATNGAKATVTQVPLAQFVTWATQTTAHVTITVLAFVMTGGIVFVGLEESGAMQNFTEAWIALTAEGTNAELTRIALQLLNDFLPLGVIQLYVYCWFVLYLVKRSALFVLLETRKAVV